MALQSTEPTRRVRRVGPQNGYILLPVVLLITLISVVAFLLNHESALGTGMTGSLNEAQRADSVAQAGLQHAIWGVQNSGCAGDLTLASIPLGADSYQATVTSAVSTTTYTVNVDQDAWLKESSPGENHGADGELSAKAAAGDDMRALYRFDISAIPAGAQIGSATAWFYVTANDDKGAVNIHEITAAWTEAAATWTTTADQFNSEVIASIPAQGSGGVWVQVNLTALVQSWVNGSSNNGIMLVATSDAVESKYTSREWSPGSERPWLQVVASSGPASPVTVSATGTLANGVTRTLDRVDVPAYQTPSSLVWQPGAELQDAFVWDGAHKFKNFGVSSILNIKNDRNVLIRFALEALPPGARVTDARLGLYLEGGSGVVNGVLDLHRISRSWAEGIYDDVDPATGDGVTYQEYDGGNAWTTPGGDYDATVIDSVTLPSMVPGWYEWNVTGQIQAWLDGAPNYGFLLREGGGDAGDIDFTSSDNTGNPENHPRLTLTFACECGIACQVPQGSGNILMVVSNEWFMTDGETVKKSLFESWGYTVDLISQWDVDWNFDAKAANNDVVYVSEAVTSTTFGMADKLAATALGVINEDGGLNDELGIAAGLAWPVGNSINITDTSHYISQPFAAGSLPIFSASMQGLTVSGSEAGGLQTLAEWGSAGSLVVLDTGAALEGGGSAPGRRVMLPLGQDQNFNPDYLNNNGRLMVQRAIQWASGIDNNPNSGHWLFDDAVGTLASDSSGRGNDGTLTNGPQWVAGKLNDALDFDGIDDRVLVADAASLDITDNITLAAWIKPNKTGTQYVIRKAQFDSTDGYELSLSTTGKVFFRLNQASNANTYLIDSTTSYPDNGTTWMHIAATYDGAVMRLYLNGMEEASLNATISIATNNTDLSIGAQVDGSRGIDGVIDDVWLYGEAMSATEIADLANSGHTPLVVLLVVGNATTLSSKDVGYKALIESWGHTVTLIDDGDSQANYDTAMAAADVICASGSALGANMLDKATNTVKGVVNEVNGKIDNFGFSNSTSSTVNTDAFSKTDALHYITEPFGGNPVTVFTASLTNPVPGGTLAPDLQNVGEVTGTLALGTLDAGATRWDGNPSQGRRAHLPFATAETTDMTADGKTVLQRAIEWAAGAGSGGGGGGSPPPTGVIFEEFTDASLGSNGKTLTISKPGGTAAGDLLIAAVATDGKQETWTPPSAGWNLVDAGSRSEQVSLAVWWKLAGSSEPAGYNFSWGEDQEAYAWIMRFTGQDSVNPIDVSASAGGSSTSPSSPAVTTSVADVMILRIGGFDDDDISVDAPGLAGHTAITMDKSGGGNGTCSGGAGYITQTAAGNSGTSSFSLTRSEQFRAVTIGIAPAP